MNNIPAGKDGAPEPGRDVVEGKPAPTGYGQAPPANWRQWARIIVWIVIAVIALLFILTNKDQVTISFVFFSAQVPLFVGLIVTLVLGMLLGGLLVVGWRRRRVKARRAERD